MIIKNLCRRCAKVFLDAKFFEQISIEIKNFITTFNEFVNKWMKKGAIWLNLIKINQLVDWKRVTQMKFLHNKVEKWEEEMHEKNNNLKCKSLFLWMMNGVVIFKILFTAKFVDLLWIIREISGLHLIYLLIIKNVYFVQIKI